ncbi:MAG: OmpA/MotB protein, partial [Bacteroidota bacterium]
MQAAADLYGALMQVEDLLPMDRYHYAETLVGIGRYEEAKKWFSAFLEIEPQHEKARLMEASCDLIPTLKPYFPALETRPFPHNSAADDNAPVGWQGGVLFTSDRPASAKDNKGKSDRLGRVNTSLYFSAPDDKGGFRQPELFSANLVESNKNLSNASFSPDGQMVCYTRNDLDLNQRNSYSLQLFTARKTGNGKWKDVSKLPFCNVNFNYLHPAFSTDGKTIFFVSNKTGGIGGTDLWMVRRNEDGWGQPENLGDQVNTPFNEGFPFMDSDGRLYFCSKGHVGYGGYDLFVTQQDADGSWLPPVNLGNPINSSLDDISFFIDLKSNSGYFTSSREGGDHDIYLFSFIQPTDTPETAPVPSPISDVLAMTSPEVSDANQSVKQVAPVPAVSESAAAPVVEAIEPEPAVLAVPEVEAVVPEPEPAVVAAPVVEAVEPEPAVLAAPEVEAVVPEPEPAAVAAPEVEAVVPEPEPAAVAAPGVEAVVPEPAAVAAPEVEAVVPEPAA